MEEIGAEQLMEWQAYYAVEPWGEVPADRRNAAAMALLANIHRKAGARAFSVDDFMPQDAEQAKKRRSADLEQRLRSALGRRGP